MNFRGAVFSKPRQLLYHFNQVLAVALYLIDKDERGVDLLVGSSAKKEYIQCM